MSRALSILASLAAAGAAAGCGTPVVRTSVSTPAQQAPAAALVGQSGRAGAAAGGPLPHPRAISAVPPAAAASGPGAAAPTPAAAEPVLDVTPAEHPIVALGDSITYG